MQHIFKSLLTILLCSFLLSGCGSSTSKTFAEYLNSGEYVRTAAYYNNHKEDIKIENYSADIKSQVDSVYSMFQKGNIKASVASANLNALRTLSSDEVQKEIDLMLNSINGDDKIISTNPTTGEITNKSEINTEQTTEAAPLKLMTITDAHEFNSGVAWVRSPEGLHIVDTEGIIIKSFSSDYLVLSDFKNGYSLIDNNSSFVTTDYRSASSDAIVVDNMGNTIFQAGADGIKKIYDYSGISEGSVIVIKNFDTLEKSGDFYYHYNLATGKEIELSQLIGDEYGVDNLEYVGNEYYYLKKNSDKEILKFVNFITEELMVFNNVLDDSYIVDEQTSIDDKLFFILRRSNSQNRSAYIVDLKEKNVKKQKFWILIHQLMVIILHMQLMILLSIITLITIMV